MEEERDGGENRHGEHDALCLQEFQQGLDCRDCEHGWDEEPRIQACEIGDFRVLT